jgi:hypothetical protein
MWDARNPRWLLVGLVVVAVGIQFIPAETTNPPEDATQTIEALTEVPAEIKTTLDNACMDCHSNRTRWPWYGSVAPVSWMVASDVRHAREHFNFSTWGKLSPDDIDHTLYEMCEEVEGGKMPLASYRWMHSEAKLSESQVFALCDWTMEERGRIRAAAGGELPKDDSPKADDDHEH